MPIVPGPGRREGTLEPLSSGARAIEPLGKGRRVS
jgi:hypothetical protein